MTAQYDHRIYVAPLATNEQLREQKLSVRQVAEILDVSRMTVYRLVEVGALRVYRVGPAGRNIRVPISAVRAYLAGSAMDLEAGA